jgi:chromosome segregation ATPase
LWGSNFERAAFSILENPDLSALIVEVQSDSHGCSYLKQIAALGVEAPVVMVLPEGAGSPDESLKAGAGNYIEKGPSFSQELPAVVGRTLRIEQAAGVARDHRRAETVTKAVGSSSHQHDHTRAAEQAPAAERQATLEMVLRQEREIRSGLEQKLADAQAALHDAEQRHRSDNTATAAQLAEHNTQYETTIAHAAATQKMVEEQLRQVRQSRAAAVADAERLTRRNAELTSMLSEATANGNALERRLADLEDAVEAANQRASHDQIRAADQASTHQAALQTQLEREIERRQKLEEDLARARRAHEEADAQRTSAVAAATALWADRQAQFEAELAQAADTRNALSREARELKAALDQARQTLHARAADVERLTQREADLTSQLAEHEAEVHAQLEQEVEKRRNAEAELARVKTALENVEKPHSSVAAVANALLAKRQAQFDAEMAEAAEARNTFGRRAIELEAALDRAQQTLQAHAADVERLTRREGELTSQLAEAGAMRHTLERQLKDAADALKDAVESASRNRLTSATKAAEREREFEALIRQERSTRADVEQRLAQAEATRHEMEQAVKAAATDVDRLTRREADLSSQLAEGAAVRKALEQQLIEAADTLKAAAESAGRDRVAADTKAAERESQFERLIHHERAARADVEQRLTVTEAALREAEQKHTLAVTATATERAERQAQFDAELSQLTQREADLISQLAEAAAVRSTLERQLTDTADSLKAAHEGATRERVAAETKAVEREREFMRLIDHERTARADVEQRLAESDASLRETKQQHAAALAAATTEIDRLTHREAELGSQLAEAAVVRSTLERQLTDSADALKAAHEGARRDRVAAETHAAEREAEFQRLVGDERTARADVEQRLAQQTADGEALDRTLAEVRAAAAAAEQRFRDETAALTARARDEVTRLEHQFANARDGHNTRQAALLNEIQGLHAARDAAHQSLAAIREQLRRREIDYQNERDGLERARLAAEADVRRLAAELAQSRDDVEKARTDFQQTLDRVTGEHADSLAKLVVEGAERDARIDDLKHHLDENRRELRRQFQDAPLPLWRCTRDGALTEANRALAHLVGYREPDEWQNGDFVKTVFESTDDLSWLIERCLSTKTRQSVETAWKRRNDERLVVRLSATQFGPDTIEIAVEDVTNVHVLEDRLARAHRMAAVGGLASETAVTCGRLLRDVREDGQQWLLAVSDDSALRKRGERLLGEVARAASYLERLAAHGDEQASALKPVELNRVLRDLKPVLKHVAGDDVHLELAKISSPLNVDMKADRVERLFVNLASYGRERMPGGGRLRIELATVVVDQKFIAEHPNVRRGHHALITVTAMRRDLPDQTSSAIASEKPGVDLGALQELLQECGGHLWLTVDPPGNMVVKLRLPLRVWEDRPHSTTSDTPTGPKRAMARWFRQ